MSNNANHKYVKRPLVIGTLFFILGLIGGELHDDIVQFSIFCIVILLIIIGMYIYYKKVFVFIYLSISILGIISLVYHPSLKEEKIFEANNETDILIQGRVLEIKKYPYSQSYIINPSKTFINNKEKKIKGLVQVVTKKEYVNIYEGDLISTYGKIESLSYPRNPGGFDERKYLLIRNVVGKIKAEEITVESMNQKGSVFRKLRNYYGIMFEKIIPWNEAQIMKSMLIGDKSLLAKDIQELYGQVGIAHILAISGLHISVIANMLLWVLQKLKLPKSVPILIVLVILWLYAGIVGFSISITRAVIMSTSLFIGRLLDEQSDTLTSLSFAALVLLIYQNLYLWDIGFQLSFSAVASLLLLTPFLNKVFIIPQKIRKYISPTIAVTIGTTPILAYYYYIISPIGIIANLFMLPLASIVVIIGFIAMIISPVHILIGKWIIGGAYYILLIIENLSKLALRIPFSTIIVGKPSRIDLFMYILFFILVFIYLNTHLEQRQYMKKYIVMGCTTIILIFCIKRLYPQDLQVAFLDVGQGDCIIIKTPTHKTFIIDGGGQGNGKKIEQFLKYNGIANVDGVILSHTHSDHMEGIRELVLRYPIRKIFVSEFPLEEKSFAEFYDTIHSRDIPMYTLSSGDFIQNHQVLLECIYPPSSMSGVSGNNASAVVVLTYKDVSYYFTGDIESPYEEGLIPHIKRNIINILKVPHHGSNTSSTQTLVKHLNPYMAVISCGKNNIYGHPNEAVLDRYKDNSIPVIQTKDQGAIIISSNSKKVLVQTMKNKEMLWK